MTIFEFQSYREYLKAYIENLPKRGRGELTRIAEHLHINTTLISQILAEGREFTFEQAFKLSQYLGHSELEADYFYMLVQIERAGSHELRTHLKKKLELLKKEALKLSKRVTTEKNLTDQEKSIFYSSYLYSAIHIFTSLKSQGVTVDEVVERFRLSKSKALEILRFLTQTGICNEVEGYYQVGIQSTFVEQGSPHLVKHHSNWRVRAVQKSEMLLDSEMMFTAQVSLSKKDFQLLREKLAEFIKQAANTVKASEAEEIACLNIDWFWLD